MSSSNHEMKQSVKGILLVTVVQLGMLVILCALAAALIINKIVPYEASTTTGMICSAAAVFTGALLITRKANNAKLVRALLGTAGYLLVLLLANLLFCPGVPAGFLRIGAPAIVMSVAASALASRKPKKRTVRRKR